MIPLLLAAGRTALAAGRVSSAVSAAKGVTSALKNRGYISKAGNAVRQMVRRGMVPRGNSPAFKNPYTFANKPGEQATAGSDMGSSVQENTQTQSNTKKQTLIISADNVFLRTSKAIMDSVMPAAPENIEPASGVDEPTSPDLKKEPSKTKTDSIMLLGIIIGKAIGAIIKKLKDLLDPLFKLFARGLATVYRGLAKVTFGGLSKAYTSTADSLEAYGESPAATDKEPEATTPGMAPTEKTPGVTPTAEPSPVASGYTPAVTPTTPTSPKSTYAAPSGFFGAPTMGTSTTTEPAIATNNDSVQSLVKKMNNEETPSNKGTTETSSSGAFKNRQDFVKGMLPYAQEAASQLGGVDPIGLLTQWDLESGGGRSVSGDFNYFGMKAGKDWTGGKKLVKTQEVLDEKGVQYYKSGKNGVEFLGPVPGKKGRYFVKDWFKSYKNLDEAVNDKIKLLKGKRYKNVRDTTSSTEFYKELQKAGYATDENYANVLQKREKVVSDTLKKVNMPAQVKTSSPNNSILKPIKPQSSAGSLSAPTQATGRNIETTSQILNSAPSVTTAQNTQPVVINNINAPTVASGKGSSSPAIEVSLFRNIDNSIQANTNRHLRAGVLGV